MALRLGVTVRELHGHAVETRAYDPDGVLLSVSFAEPRFTPTEVGKLLASCRAEVARRGAHGRLLSEAMDPANQFAYSVPRPTMDWAQRALTAAQEAYKKANPNADMAALLWRVEKAD